MKRPQVSADDLHNYRTLFSRGLLGKYGCEPQTRTEDSRAESTQRLASATRVADIGNEDIALERHNKLRSKEVIKVSVNAIATLKRNDRKRAYAQGLPCLCVPASLASISAYACVPEVHHVHTSHTSH